MQNVELAKRILKENNVKWIHGQFVDLLGHLRSFSMPASTYFEDDIWKNGVGFDGSSVKGFASVDHSDMIAIPDPTTMLPLPWLYDGDRARVMMDVFDVRSRNPFAGDPRNIARIASEQVAGLGYDALHVAPEFEFHIFRQSQVLHDRAHLSLQPLAFDPIQAGGYFASPPADSMEPFRTRLSNALIASGINVKYHHHEGGTWQHEVEIAPQKNAVIASDVTILFKFMAQTLGAANDFLITFMPKPVPAEAGNGMHVHLELFKDGASVFYDADEDHQLSQTARYFIGGILDHAPAMTAVTNPTVNSYKRLVPHYEAPIHIVWATHNRSSLVRIPSQTGNGHTMDIEIRHPDPSANPYLAFAVIIQAGIDGIKKQQEPGDSIEKNIYAMDYQELANYHIRTLPRNLKEALEALQSDQVIQDVLGPHVLQAFIDIKNREWTDFLMDVSSWDYRHYFSV